MEIFKLTIVLLCIQKFIVYYELRKKSNINYERKL